MTSSIPFLESFRILQTRPALAEFCLRCVLWGPMKLYGLLPVILAVGSFAAVAAEPISEPIAEHSVYRARHSLNFLTEPAVVADAEPALLADAA